ELSGKPVGHVFAGLAGLDAALPCFLSRLELAERRRNRAGRLLPELMAADAVDVVHLPQPILPRDILRNVTCAAELARGRNLQHRVPIDGRVILRRRGLVRSGHGAQIELLAGLAVDLW